MKSRGVFTQDTQSGHQMKVETFADLPNTSAFAASPAESGSQQGRGGGGKVAQLTKHLLNKLDGTVQDLHHPWKKLDTVTGACNPRTGETRWKGFRVLLPHLANLQVPQLVKGQVS